MLKKSHFRAFYQTKVVKNVYGASILILWTTFYPTSGPGMGVRAPKAHKMDKMEGPPISSPPPPKGPLSNRWWLGVVHSSLFPRIKVVGGRRGRGCPSILEVYEVYLIYIIGGAGGGGQHGSPRWILIFPPPPLYLRMEEWNKMDTSQKILGKI